jgi:hypothetical protein
VPGSNQVSLTQEVKGGQPLAATIVFGQPDHGSPFPPPSGHDQSPHAKENLAPRTVVMAQGGTVTFDLSGPGRAIHQVAIFPNGTDPADVDTSMLNPPAASGRPHGRSLARRDPIIWRRDIESASGCRC